MIDPQRLAEPLPVSRRGEVDTEVLVIGSGFGGSVAAVRFAELGASVLVVERGREAVSGEFPTTFAEVAAELRGPANPLGLFDVRLSPDLHVVAGNGLGGGSLHYAGVTLAPDDSVFDARDPSTGRRVWPERIDGKALRDRYEQVRSMLAVEVWLDESDVDGLEPDASLARDVYGRTARERPCLPKSEPIRRLAERHGMRCYRPPLAINLTKVPDGAVNEHGVTRGLCTHCGRCVMGCNFAAMNSLTTNYLPSARARGASICVGVEVVRLRRGRRRRWAVEAIHRSVADGRRRARRVRLHADIVVVAAGMVGSTELMLRSRCWTLPLSPALGTRISGNGDAIALSLDGDDELRAVATDPDRPQPGPTITLTADIVTEHGRSLIQDGALPLVIQPRTGRILARLTRRPRFEPDRYQVWLAMGTDSAAGRADLDRHGRLRIHWPNANTAPAQRQREAWLVELVRLQGGEPLLASLDGSRAAGRAAVTVHPLGGCPMADDPQHGVVDAACRVHRPRGDVHTGLFIMDGSVLPTSVGVNPSLAIAALVERAMREVAG